MNKLKFYTTIFAETAPTTPKTSEFEKVYNAVNGDWQQIVTKVKENAIFSDADWQAISFTKYLIDISNEDEKLVAFFQNKFKSRQDLIEKWDLTFTGLTVDIQSFMDSWFSFSVQDCSFCLLHNRDRENIDKSLVQKLIKRVQAKKIYNDDTVVEILIKLGLLSPGKIVHQYRIREFVNLLIANGISERIANGIYQTAQNQLIAIEEARQNMHQWQTAGLMPVFATSGIQPSTVQSNTTSTSVNYADFFKDTVVTEVKEGESIFSIAAYLVEILMFLDKSKKEDENKKELEHTPFKEFKKRRPDIFDLDLSAENSLTVSPYIDLVLEILETYVAEGEPSVVNIENETTELLYAEPQTLNFDAYKRLEESFVAAQLPYSQPLNAIREHLPKLGIDRLELLKHFGEKGTTLTNAQTAEELGITENEFRLFTGKCFNGDDSEILFHELYSGSFDESVFSHIKNNLLTWLEIPYADMEQILKCKFINPKLPSIEDQKILTRIKFSFNFLKHLKSKNKIENAISNPCKFLTEYFNNDNNFNFWCECHQIDKSEKDEIKKWVKTKFKDIGDLIVIYDYFNDTNDSFFEGDKWTIQDGIDYKMLRKLSSDKQLLDEDFYQKLNIFVRLKKILGWTYAELDLALRAVGHKNNQHTCTSCQGSCGCKDCKSITPETLKTLLEIKHLVAKLNWKLDEVLALWNDLELGGSRSLYSRTFLKLGRNSYKFLNPKNEGVEIWEEFKKAEFENKNDIYHKELVQGIFNRSLAGICTLIEQKVTDKIDLDLKKLSEIYRKNKFANYLRLKPKEYSEVINYLKINPFESPKQTKEFIKQWEKIGSYKNFEVIKFLTNDDDTEDRKFTFKETEKVKLTQAITKIKETLDKEFVLLDTAKGEAANAEQLRTLLLKVYEDSVYVDRIVGTLDGSFETFSALEAPPASSKDRQQVQQTITIKSELPSTVRYEFKKIIVKGIISQDDEDKAKLYFKEKKFTEENVNEAFSEINNKITSLFETILNRLEQFKKSDKYKKLLELLIKKVSVNNLETSFKLTELYNYTIDFLKERQIRIQLVTLVSSSFRYDSNGIVQAILYDNLLKNSGNNNPWDDAEKTNNLISTKVEYGLGEAMLDVSKKLKVRFVTNQKDTKDATISIGGNKIGFKMNDEVLVEEYVTEFITLEPSTFPYKIEISNISIEGLKWQEEFKQTSLIPTDVLVLKWGKNDGLDNIFALLNKIALLTRTYEIDMQELTNFLSDAIQKPRLIDEQLVLESIKFEYLKSIHDYKELQAKLQNGKLSCLDFKLLMTEDKPIKDNKEFKENFEAFTKLKWKDVETTAQVFQFVSTSQFDDLKEIWRLIEAAALVNKTDIEPKKLIEWAKANPCFHELWKDSITIKFELKCQLDQKSWEEVSKKIYSGLRQNQRNALVSYILQKPEVKTLGITNANKLSNYFYIDLMMDSDRPTSKIVQATNSVQTFVHRIFRNLEPNLDNNSLSREHWSWMRKYRLWEANRKIFLYPENWLETNLRDDKSVFFKALEGELLSENLENDRVLDAVTNYLSSVNDIANLDMVGMYIEGDPTILPVQIDPYPQNEEGIEVTIIKEIKELSTGSFSKKLHLFGKDRKKPSIFYYRLVEYTEAVKVYDILITDIKNNTTNQRRVYRVELELPTMRWHPWTVVGDSIQTHEFDLDLKLTIKKSLEFSYLDDSVGKVIVGNDDEVWKNIFYETAIPSVLKNEIIEKIYKIPIEFKKEEKVKEDGIEYDKYSPISELMFIENDKKQKLEIRIETKNATTNKKELKSYPIKVNCDLSLYCFETVIESVLSAVRMISGKLELNYLKESLQNKTGLILNSSIFDSSKIQEIESKYFLNIDNIENGFKYPIKEAKIRKVGSYLLPVVWNNRLFIFHPVISKKPIPIDKSLLNVGNSGDIVNKVTQQEQKNQIEIRMAYSEFRSGKWTPKKESFDFDIIGTEPINETNFSSFLTFAIESKDNENIIIYYKSSKDDEFKKYLIFSGDQVSFKPLTGAKISSIKYIFNKMDGVTLTTIQAKLNNDKIELYDTTPSFKENSFDFEYKYIAETDISVTKKSLGLIAQRTVLGINSLFEIENTDFYPILINDTFTDEEKNKIIKENKQKEESYELLFGLLKKRSEFDYLFHELSKPNSIYGWEMFFHITVLIADSYSKNEQYDEATKWYHYAFDPTRRKGDKDNSAWRFKPFQNIKADKTLDDFFNRLSGKDGEEKELAINNVEEWRNNPFMPHIVARNRPVAYMKWVIMKYVGNLILQGDSYFKQDSIENLNIATQFYIQALDLLGEKPYIIPKQAERTPKTFNEIKNGLDDFGNTIDEVHLLFPYANGFDAAYYRTDNIKAQRNYALANVYGLGLQRYFGVPINPNLFQQWETIEDRLFKIRNSLNFYGVRRTLSLFEPPIDPGLLALAKAQGFSIESLLSDLNTPVSHYRFEVLLEKAKAMCTELKSIGSTYLSILEKKDAEAMSFLRNKQETKINNLVKEMRLMQINESNETIETLRQSRKDNESKMSYFLKLVGLPISKVPLEQEVFSPIEINIDTINIENSLPVSQKEKEDIDKSNDAHQLQKQAGIFELLASTMLPLPDVNGQMQFWGLGISIDGYGGQRIGAILQSMAKLRQLESTDKLFGANKAAKLGGFERAVQERKNQINNLGYEIKQIDRQILIQEIKIKMAEHELKTQEAQIEHSLQMEEFIKNKFTNEELYKWMQQNLKPTFKEYYKLTLNMAKKAELAYRFERGDQSVRFLVSSYWDNSYAGLLSGESLMKDLSKLEMAYVERNERWQYPKFQISLRQLAPNQLLDLKLKGKCTFNIPEEYFDQYAPGHFKRRILGMKVSIPCILGPYQNVNATLRLLKNSVRIKPNIAGKEYMQQPVDDDRFVNYLVPTDSIFLSLAQNDNGLYESYNEATYFKPFEGAGAISEWSLELPENYHFDYSTISDVILHMTTRSEHDMSLQKNAKNHLNKYWEGIENEATQFVVIDLKSDLTNDWWQMLNDFGEGKTSYDFKIANLKSFIPYMFVGDKFKITEDINSVLFIDDKPYQLEMKKVANLKEVDYTITLTNDVYEAWKNSINKNTWVVIGYKVNIPNKN